MAKHVTLKTQHSSPISQSKHSLHQYSTAAFNQFAVVMVRSPTSPRHRVPHELRRSPAHKVNKKIDSPNGSEDADASGEAASTSSPTIGQENRLPVTPGSPTGHENRPSTTPGPFTHRENTPLRSLPANAGQEAASTLSAPTTSTTSAISFALPIGHESHDCKSSTTISSAYIKKRRLHSTSADLPDTETFGASGITINRGSALEYVGRPSGIDLPPSYTPSDDDRSGTRKRKQEAIVKIRDRESRRNAMAGEEIPVNDFEEEADHQTDNDGGSPRKKGKKAARDVEASGRSILDPPMPGTRRNSPNRAARLETMPHEGSQFHALAPSGGDDSQAAEQVLDSEDSEIADAQRPPAVPIRQSSVAQYPTDSTARRLGTTAGEIRQRSEAQRVQDLEDLAGRKPVQQEEEERALLIKEALQRAHASARAHAEEVARENAEDEDEENEDNDDGDGDGDGDGDNDEGHKAWLPEAGIHRTLDGDVWDDNPPYPGNE